MQRRVLVLVVLLAVGCSNAGVANPGTAPATVLSPPVEPPGREPMTLSDSVLKAGDQFEATFPASHNRGGYFKLYQWDGTTWEQAPFLLESDAFGGDEPTAVAISEDLVENAYGVEGPGPDGLILPPELEPGQWRICTSSMTGVAYRACAQFRIEQDLGVGSDE